MELLRRTQLAAVLGISVLLGLAFSWVTPLFESPDENAHLANACHVLEAHALPDSAPVVYAAHGHAVFEGHQMPLFYVLGAGLASMARVNPCAALPPPNDAPRPQENGLFFFEHPRRAAGQLLGDAWGNPAWLPRLLSVLFGALAVFFTARAAMRAFPASPWAPGVAGAWVALNPQFAFISGSAANDSAAAALGAAVLDALLRQWRDEDWSPRAAARTGVLLGVGVLMKASVLLLAAPVLFALWFGPRGVTPRQRLGACAAWAGGLVVTCGGVFVRNAVLRQDPTLWKLQLEKLPRLVAGPPSAEYLFDTLPRLTFDSYWGRFGWMNFPLPEGVARAFLVLSAIAALSVLAFIVETAFLALGPARSAEHRRLAMVSGTLVLGVLASVAGLVAYNLTFRQPQGRLLFPAIGWLGVLVAGGIAGGSARRAAQRLSAAAALGLMLGLGVATALALAHYAETLAFLLR